MTEKFDGAPGGDNPRGGGTGAPARAAERRTRRIIWVTVAIAAALLSFFLSWPWRRDFGYWPESRTMWAIYFSVGFLLAVYVFYVFFDVLRTLFAHDALERAETVAQTEADGSEGRS